MTDFMQDLDLALVRASRLLKRAIGLQLPSVDMVRDVLAGADLVLPVGPELREREVVLLADGVAHGSVWVGEPAPLLLGALDPKQRQRLLEVADVVPAWGAARLTRWSVEKAEPLAEPLESPVPPFPCLLLDPFECGSKVMTRKHEQPMGKIAVLKVPDPRFLVERLQDQKSAGLLSRRRRVSRVGQQQALVNEVGPIVRDGAFVFGIIKLGEPVRFQHVGEIPPELREGLDPLSRREFAATSDVFYLPVELVTPFDQPLKLRKTPPGRRFASEIDLGQDVVRKIQHGLDAFIASPDVAALARLADDVLHDVDERLHRFFERGFATSGANQFEGHSREDVVNAHEFVFREIERRGLAHPFDDALQVATTGLRELARKQQYADVQPSGVRTNQHDSVELAEVVRHFEKPMALRMPAVYLVGSICTKGRSENDIDLLVRGPLDDETLHAIKFRLGRALPPRLSQRVQFLDDDTGGPFTSHIPLYDLVLVPHAGRSVVEMREIQKQDDPHLDWPAKPGKRTAVLQLHFRGASVHGDFRFSVRDQHLAGWTLSIQRKDKVSEVDTVEEAKKLASKFSIQGSEFNKPMELPNRVFAVGKKRQPSEWLSIGDTKLEPGSVGATRFEPGVFAEVATPKVEFGIQTGHSHEYFVTGDPRFSGLLFFRLLEGKGPADQDDEEVTPAGQTFWTAGFTKSKLPGVLKHRAIETSSMPPLGQSAMPTSLMAVTPAEFRFWLADTAREAHEMRDALVDSRFFTEENVELDQKSEFRRVEQKVYSPEVRDQDPDDADPEVVDAGHVDPVVKRFHVQPDGTQVWAAEDQHDGNENDRTELRPPAVFQPQSSATRKTNVFRVSAQRWDDRAGVEAGVLVFTEDQKHDLDDVLPGLTDEIHKMGGDFVLDGEIMAVDQNGDFLPRCELVQFRGGGALADADLRFVVFDALYLPDAGNITAKSMQERRHLLEAFWAQHVNNQGLDRLVLSPAAAMLWSDEPAVKDPLEKWDRNARVVKILKAAEQSDERIVFGVVLVPDETDAQGDVYDAEEVRRAAYSFMEQYGGKLKLMHDGKPLDGKAIVLETYVSKHEERHGEEMFPIGTWFMTSRVSDDDLWAEVKNGKWTGYSIGGSAIRESLDQPNAIA